MGLFGKRETVQAMVPQGFRIAGAFANQGSFKAHLPGREWTEHGNASATSPCVVTLKAEPRNPYDSRAVAVKLGLVLLGHVPRAHLDWAHAELARAGKARLVANAEMLRFPDEYDLVILKTD